MIDLKDTNIILTGATGGIGNSILENLILTGANILATGTNENKLNLIKENYKKYGSCELFIFHVGGTRPPCPFKSADLGVCEGAFFFAFRHRVFRALCVMVKSEAQPPCCPSIGDPGEWDVGCPGGAGLPSPIFFFLWSLLDPWDPKGPKIEFFLSPGVSGAYFNSPNLVPVALF